MARRGPQLVMKQYDDETPTSWAIFKKTEVRNLEGNVVRWPCEAQPYKGYSSMTKAYAKEVLARLQKTA